MSNISSNTLFHFTSSIDNVVGILQNGFIPHFCLEDHGPYIPGQQEPYRLGIPIVSFCDIPLAQAVRHMQHYGRYAIGVSKEWGIRNSLTPCLYTHNGSPTTESIRELVGLEGLDSTQSGKVLDSAGRLASLSKPYEGPLERHGRILPTVRFYDEREWRYVAIDTDGNIPVMSEKKYRDVDARRTRNETLQKHSLTFSPQDIKFIIVGDSHEIGPMTAQLRGMKEKFNADDIDLLCTRILTAKNIEEDF